MVRKSGKTNKKWQKSGKYMGFWNKSGKFFFKHQILSVQIYQIPQRIKGNSGNFQVEENLRETQGNSGSFDFRYKIQGSFKILKISRNLFC